MQGNHTDFTGRVLDTFRLVQRIGHGGMSVVYLAEHISLQRQVAIKILFPGVPTGSALYAEFLERFRREARLIASLAHTNIVPIYDYKEQADLAYLVMPYFPKKSLAHLLEQRGALTLQETLEYIEQAALALDYAHGRKVIHRDLKPSNFLLHDNGHLVLTDFGIAYMMSKTTGLLTSPNVVMGTPEYIAPEMILKEQLDHRADIYELGIVLFEMLSGYLPFSGENAVEIQMQHLQVSPPLLHRLNTSIPPEVDAVMRKATAKKPEERYNSAGEMARDLRNAVEGKQAGQFASSPAPTVLASPLNDVYPAWKATIAMDPSQEAVRRLATSSVLIREARAPVQPRRVPSKKHAGIYMLVVLALFLMAGAALLPLTLSTKSTTGARPTATPDPRPAQAQNIVKQYYAALSDHDYSSAYQFWLPASRPSFCRFIDAFEYTETDQVTFTGKPELLDPTSFQVPITLHATEQLPEGTRKSIYQGDQNLRLEHGTWKIMGGYLSHAPLETAVPIVPAGSTSPDQAGTLVQAFYTDINKRDYPAAYNLWGASFRSQRSYCSFVEGYANNLGNNVTIEATSSQPDDSVIVSVEIIATEKADTTITHSIYNGMYVVGREQGLWKLLQGNLQKTGSDS